MHSTTTPMFSTTTPMSSTTFPMSSSALPNVVEDNGNVVEYNANALDDNANALDCNGDVVECNGAKDGKTETTTRTFRIPPERCLIAKPVPAKFWVSLHALHTPCVGPRRTRTLPPPNAELIPSQERNVFLEVQGCP